MINRTEEAEHEYLEQVKRAIGEVLGLLDGRIGAYSRNIREQKAYMWDQRAEMDHAEKVSARQFALETTLSGEAIQATHARIQRLLSSPYFGRFDFQKAGDDGPSLPVYVGIHSFSNTDGQSLVYDWRAPISSVFYDYELGDVRYRSPSGVIDGTVSVKRQYRIRDGKFEFMLESGLSILDDVLQQELSRTSDERMKNIVATIQRDQNAIIRNEDAPVLVIQGVAGSGKTSIALHRIAFLLYRYKETLTSREILIISPNKVFADFISNVLPELGEAQIVETEMDFLATELLDGQVRFQTFFEQMEALLKGEDTELPSRIVEKSSVGFLKRMDAYVRHIEDARFSARDVTVNGYLVPAWLIEETFNRRASLKVAERLRWTEEALESKIWTEYRYQMNATDRTSLRKSLKQMCKTIPLRTAYKQFFEWLGSPNWFRPIRGSQLEYGDVFPFIYLKMKLEGITHPYKGIKHLVVDEMQDYTPVQYAVISRLFACDKTVLGDAGQAVNPFGMSNSDSLVNVFPLAECMVLSKSYRSSYEILRFAQAISPASEFDAIERHGPGPTIHECGSGAAEIQAVVNAIRAFEEVGFSTMGIVCKTQKQAGQLFTRLQKKNVATLHLLTPKSTQFEDGVVICAAYLAKGLEFDWVHVPQVNSENYHTHMDRNLLYVACTRAMHRLTLSYVKDLSSFVPDVRG